MSKPFDIELFLIGVLTDSNTTRQRHLRQAKVIQDAITKHWQQDNPWSWQKKHLVWFLTATREERSEATNYYYLLTTQLIAKRLGKSWFVHRGQIIKQNE